MWVDGSFEDFNKTKSLLGIIGGGKEYRESELVHGGIVSYCAHT